MSKRVGAALAMLVLLAACGEQGSDAPPPEASETLPGVWAGVFPCAGCPGIDVTLWLRADQRFFIEQKYRRADAGTPATAYGLGRWVWQAGEDLLVLTGDGPERRLELAGPDALLMRTRSSASGHLQRRTGSADFDAVIRVQGTARRHGDGFEFHECLTGYEVALAQGGDYTRFSRQFRSVVPRGDPAPVEIEGRYAWGPDGTPTAFHIERFVTVRQSGGCPPP